MGWKEEAFTLSEKAKGEVTIPYPKVIFIGRHEDSIKEITFCSRNGTVIKKIPVVPATEKVIYSENGRYILKTIRYNEFDEHQEGAILYDYNGNIIWNKSKGIFTAVSDEGYTATGFASPDGSFYPFEIYDLNGIKILNEKHLGLSSSDLINAGGKFSGSFYIIGSGASRETKIYVFSLPDGKRIMGKKFMGYIWIPNIKILSQKTLALCINNEKADTLIFLDLKGKIMWRLSPPFNYFIGTVSFYPSTDDGIYVHTTNGDLLFIKNGKLISAVKINKKIKLFPTLNYGVELSNKKIRIFCLKEVLK